MKVHFGDSIIRKETYVSSPHVYKNIRNGLKSICGYSASEQRHITMDLAKVTCKACLSRYDKPLEITCYDNYKYERWTEENK